MVIESIRTNVSGLQIIQQLYKTNNRMETNLERIASGLRINRASDDPGGFVLSNTLKTQFRGMSRASENTQEAISLVNTAESAVSEIIELLNDIRTSAVAAAGGSATEQAVILEKIEEINNIAESTKYGNYYLLNGALTSSVDFREGTRDFGASLSFGPNATTLDAGRSYLNIGVTNQGTTEIKNAGDGTFNTGLAVSTDIAVTTSQFIESGAAADTTDLLSATTTNRVSMVSTDVMLFQGTLADGVTFFSGSYSITAASTVGNLISSIQSAIDAQESDLGIDGTGDLETTVGIDADGRLQFTSGTKQEISEFDINLTLENSGGTAKTDFAISRDATIYNPEVGGTATGASIGNNTTSVTGSTFDSGTFTITVSNVVAAQQRVIVTDEFDRNGGGAPVRDFDAVAGSFFNGVSIADGATFQINGTEPDGSTFSTTYTVGTDTGVGDGIVTDYGDLVEELNNRNQSLTSRGFNGAMATLTGNGEIELYDDVSATSSTDLEIIVQTVSGSDTASSTVTQAGTEETATLSIDGGSSATVTAGEVVTLKGTNASGGPEPEVTFRVGSGFAAGDDELETTAKEFTGSLNGGEVITFQNGDNAVTFTAGEFSIYPVKKFQQATLDFDAILDVTNLASSGGETFVISTTSNAANFQIGTDEDSIKSFLFADLRSDNLGTDASNTLDDIDVTTASGATAALDIVDDALDQVNEFGGRLGAFSARLDDTVSALDAGVTNIETAYARIVSADIAKETTELTLNSVLLQAQSAVLVQANSAPQAVLQILLDLD